MKNDLKTRISYFLMFIMLLFTFQATSAWCKQYSRISHDTKLKFNITQDSFIYSGYYYDTETKNDYLNARYYSPELMSFISRDTYDLANRYAYCGGDPLSNTDPTGHSFSSILGSKTFHYAMAGIAISTCDPLGFAIAGTQIAADSTKGKTSSDFSNISTVGSVAAIGIAVTGTVASLVCFAKALRSSEKIECAGNEIELVSSGTKRVKCILRKNNFDYKGAKILAEKKVMDIFRILRDNEYYAACTHESLLWYAARNKVKIPFDSLCEMLEMTTSGTVDMGLLTGGMGLGVYKDEFEKSIKLLKNLKKEGNNGLFASWIESTENHARYCDIPCQSMNADRFVLRYSEWVPGNRTWLYYETIYSTQNEYLDLLKNKENLEMMLFSCF